MAAPASAPVPVIPVPRVAFDADTLAQWAPDPVAGYDEIVRRPAGEQTLSEWAAILDRHLGTQPPNRRAMLVVHYARLAVKSVVAEAVKHAHKPGEASSVPQFTYRLMDVDRLRVLAYRMRLDQTGWDFIGTVLFLLLATSSNPMAYFGPVAKKNIAIVATMCVSVCILHSLIYATRQTVNMLAMTLTWSRMLALAREWARTGKVCGVPLALVAPDANQTLDQFLAIAATFDAESYWNEEIDKATRHVHADMTSEAHRAQNELTRPSCPLSADAIGLIAQFLAPPGTSQNALQAQRTAYAASVKTARLQVVAAHAREGARKLAQACLDKDREESAKRQRV